MKCEYQVAGQQVKLELDESVVAVRFKGDAKHSVREAVSRKCKLGHFHDRCEVAAEKFTILSVNNGGETSCDHHQTAVQSLENNGDVSRVSHVFKLGETVVLATDRIMLGLEPGTANIDEIIKEFGGSVVDVHDDEYVIQLLESDDPIELANKISGKDGVVYAEPDFVSINHNVDSQGRATPQPMATDPDAGRQYAINITKAKDAWQLQSGDPDIRIAILDEGVDTNHEDLSAAIVSSYDGVDNDLFQEPKPWNGHGTACAGLAAAIHNNDIGIKGIGGGCSIMAVRIAYSDRPRSGWVIRNSWVKRAIDWSWRNGADVISNSWGGGAPSTAVINAIERARTQGRGGKGSVVVFAAGNDAGPVSFPGSLSSVLTVSASNEFDEFKTKTSRDGETWWGSNFGPEVDLAAPGVHNWTTDISGSGGYTSGNYSDFNGTSSATPIVAGAAALVLSANKQLSELEVREALKQSADQVGSFAYSGGRNNQFGSGRLNVVGALQRVIPQQLSSYVTIHKVIQDVPIKDKLASQLAVYVGDIKPLQDIKVHIEIEHTYIGDLQIDLIPPATLNEAPVPLFERTGGDQDNLTQTYDVNSKPDLARLIGKQVQGEWQLKVHDHANQDEGKIVSFSVELTL